MTASSRPPNGNALVVSYIAAWNEPDPARRRDLVAKTWTDGGTYVDGARHGEGHDAIAGMIAGCSETLIRTSRGYWPYILSKVPLSAKCVAWAFVQPPNTSSMVTSCGMRANCLAYAAAAAGSRGR